MHPQTQLYLAYFLAVTAAVTGVIAGFLYNHAYNEVQKLKTPSTDTISTNVLTKADRYNINVGSNVLVFSAEQLESGINLRQALHGTIGWAFNAPIKVSIENNKVHFDIAVFNEKEQLVFKIIDNEFTFNPDGKFDRNYNFSALEVVDQDLVPHIQIYLKDGNNIYIGGSSRDKDMIRLFSPDGTSSHEITDINKLPIQRLFKYPSRNYLGIEEKENAPFPPEGTNSQPKPKQ